MTAHVGWDQQRVDGLTATEAAKLRADLSRQSISRDAGERRDAIALIQMLSSRTDGARSVEERAADAKTFLYGSKDAKAAERAWEVACNLYTEKGAIKRGYSDPRAA